MHHESFTKDQLTTLLELPEAERQADFERERSKSRLSTPAVEGGFFDDTVETFADSTCPIAMFDEKPSQSQSQKEAADQEGKGYSRNTVKALALIRKELQPPAAEGEKVISFQQMSNKVCFDPRVL